MIYSRSCDVSCKSEYTLVRALRIHKPCSRWGLPPGVVTNVSWALLPPSFHPYQRPKDSGGIVSVALSLRSPWVAVSDHPYSSCSDFPLRIRRWERLPAYLLYYFTRFIRFVYLNLLAVETIINCGVGRSVIGPHDMSKGHIKAI